MNLLRTKLQLKKNKLNKVLFWAASFTWGLPISFVGSIVALALLIAGYKPKRFHWFICFVIGENWGGFSCGTFMFVSRKAKQRTLQHEAGHGLQNIMFGFFMPIVVSIPSAIRYWYREILKKVNTEKYKTLPDYESIWFENQATRLGQKYFK